MKTLDEWLKDSSSDDDAEQAQLTASGGGAPRNSSDGGHSTASRALSSGASMPGSLISAHTPTTLRPAKHQPGGLYGRQDETREKMMRLLGADAVAKATLPASSSASISSPVWPLAAPPDRNHFLFGETPIPSNTHANPTTCLPARPLAAGIQSDTAANSSQVPVTDTTMQRFNSDPAYEAVEVMVVDRGTQTVSTVGTQTDPLPTPFGTYCPGPVAPWPCMGASAYARWAPPIVPLPSHSVTVDNQPFRQYYDDYEQREAAETAHLRSELEMIQNSIDMLIARYNLPPPPT
ncbi:hypothetical protein JKF63_02958 [Porcisia hertigi]|uniref:Uncharacterized protein n=1 Tax=Porcisia hertigi TaxID=2761500 RepID=A0A836IIW5_9TRYP|nr:hypothetical protein JKF63_02958 [Porcisia hertigi]